MPPAQTILHCVRVASALSLAASIASVSNVLVTVFILTTNMSVIIMFVTFQQARSQGRVHMVHVNPREAP